MSLGNTFASSTNCSSTGTTSTIGSPGLTTPPTVFTITRLTIPATGERISVRPFLSFKLGKISFSERYSAKVLLDSARASERNCRTALSFLAMVSSTPDCKRLMADRAVSSRPSASAKLRSKRTNSSLGSRPLATSLDKISRSSRPKPNILLAVAKAMRFSCSSCVFCSICACNMSS